VATDIATGGDGNVDAVGDGDGNVVDAVTASVQLLTYTGDDDVDDDDDDDAAAAAGDGAVPGSPSRGATNIGGEVAGVSKLLRSKARNVNTNDAGGGGGGGGGSGGSGGAVPLTLRHDALQKILPYLPSSVLVSSSTTGGAGGDAAALWKSELRYGVRALW
jgi:hypothetical protein